MTAMIIGSPINISSIRNLMAMSALAVMAVSPSMAQVTFAQYDQVNGATQEWSISTTTSGEITTTVSSTGSVEFTFSGIPGEPLAEPQTATFTLNATSTQLGNCGSTCGPGDSYVQPGYSGTFSFIDTTLGPDDGDNLLSGTFAVTGSPSTTGAQFSSSIGGGSGSFTASATAGNLNQLVLTSAFINFTGSTLEVASFSLSSLVPNFALQTPLTGGNQGFPTASFNASGSGTFSAAAPALVTPEPATVFLIGGGLLGLDMVRRRKLVRL
jgi:hypothetical protein